MAVASGSGNGSGSGHASSSTVARNHPFRLEVQEITPVSASILWSLRPPPLSAIPRNLLRQPKQSAAQRQDQSAASSSSSQNVKTPAYRLAGEAGVTATRSINRKVTKVTLRNISPHKQQPRSSKQGQGHVPGMESEDWPSDDEATAVDEDEQREEDEADHERTLEEDQSRLNADDDSDASDDGAASAKIFDSGVSVCVNGVPWSQVMMGDRGADEAFMVVYGLSPSRDYELMLKVEGEEQSAVVALSTTAEREEKTAAASQQSNTATEQTRSSTQAAAAPPPAALPGLRVHTPPMQDTDASPIDAPSEASGFPNSSITATASSASSTLSSAAIQASIRRARKEASRAESALRSEIEAIKRGLERMSDVDHRSKQKVLALQESIRQATLHAKDLDEEATEVEGEREEWERREREKEAELQSVRRAVEENLRQGDAKTKQDDEDVEAVEKELQKATRVLEDKWTARLKVERERVAEAEQELMRVQMENDSILRPQAYSQIDNQHFSSPSNERITFSHSQSTQAGIRGKGRGAMRAGPSRSTPNASVGSTPASRKTYNKPRGAIYSNASDDLLYDYHGSSSSSAHGSTLNPHNPEFVPASASPILPKTADHSPSAPSRFAFAHSSHFNREHEPSLLNTTAHMSPRINNGTSSAIPWAAGGGLNNQTMTVPYWSTSSMNPSPTLGHDIWGALPNTSSPLAASQQTPPLHTKTSIPYLSPLRSAHHITPSEESHHRGPYLHFAREEEDAAVGRRRGSAPVSPSLSP